MKEYKSLQDRTKNYALRIIRLVSSLPKTTEATAIGRQLIRSGTSVAANTRSAFRARSKKEFIAKLGIVIEETDESMLWLELLKDSKIVGENKLINLLQETNELVSIFVSIVKSSKNKTQSHKSDL
ncbi:MAG: four helix bundle protein [Candidatus Marinimicrobia bacterium]|nr:four helix bundle protein [Candidatus Neomarinimicrobiota bacterium]MBL7047645.1 four helix bundle protein [Candidatus Neomarinimicrobiota bacterium]